MFSLDPHCISTSGHVVLLHWWFQLMTCKHCWLITLLVGAHDRVVGTCSSSSYDDEIQVVEIENWWVKVLIEIALKIHLLDRECGWWNHGDDPDKDWLTCGVQSEPQHRRLDGSMQLCYTCYPWSCHALENLLSGINHATWNLVQQEKMKMPRKRARTISSPSECERLSITHSGDDERNNDKVVTQR